VSYSRSKRRFVTALTKSQNARAEERGHRTCSRRAATEIAARHPLLRSSSSYTSLSSLTTLAQYISVFLYLFLERSTIDQTFLREPNTVLFTRETNREESRMFAKISELTPLVSVVGRCNGAQCAQAATAAVLAGCVRRVVSIALRASFHLAMPIRLCINADALKLLKSINSHLCMSFVYSRSLALSSESRARARPILLN
jgi:hypothetical protein